jgi:tetratricopeptide (TPR) repeat protein
MGQQFERDGNYYKQLVEFELEHLQLSREIGDRPEEGNALMFCGQIQGLYLGDYEAGLELQMQSLRIWEVITDRIFPLLRITQIQTEQGLHADALKALEMARPLGEKVVYDIGRAGLGLVTVILYNALGDEQHLRSALEIASQIQKMVADNLVSRQYHMAAACAASITYMNLAQLLMGEKAKSIERQPYLEKALESSQTALNLYEQFGFVQVVECTSEEIFFRHSQSLIANNRIEEGVEFLNRAHKEMMRKHDLIPAESPYRKTYLENIQLHRDIQAAYAKQIAPAARRRKAPSSSKARTR